MTNLNDDELMKMNKERKKVGIYCYVLGSAAATCEYECEQTGGCTVKYTGPSRTGDTIVSNFNFYTFNKLSITRQQGLQTVWDIEKNYSEPKLPTLFRYLVNFSKFCKHLQPKLREAILKKILKFYKIISKRVRGRG